MLNLLAQVLVLHLQPPDPAKLDEIERFNQRFRAELAKVEAAAEEARREHLIRGTCPGALGTHVTALAQRRRIRRTRDRSKRL